MAINDASFGYLVPITLLALSTGYLAFKLVKKPSSVVVGTQEGAYGAATIPTFFVSPEDGSSIEAREISRIPGTGLVLPHDPNNQTNTNFQAVNQAGSLVENLFKGAVSTPGKTLEVVFKPNIQDGLKAGRYTLMKTKAGETLADATDSSGRIVGKGRLLETGRAKQLVGASYQLLSIAVAQSHLADINQKLSKVEDLVRDVLRNLEDGEQGKIKGDVETLKQLVEKMRGMDATGLSNEQAQSLQDISRSFNQYQETILNNFDSAIQAIESQGSTDTFGADNTFWDLKDKVESTTTLLQRNDLMLQLSAIHRLVAAWSDPSGERFSTCQVRSDEWRNRMQKFESAVTHKTNELFKDVTFNSSQQLRLYRASISHATNESARLLDESLQSYEVIVGKIDGTVHRIASNHEVRLAVSFDDAGKTKQIALI